MASVAKQANMQSLQHIAFRTERDIDKYKATHTNQPANVSMQGFSDHEIW